MRWNRLASVMLVVGLCALAPDLAAAQTVAGYLNGAPLGYTVPPPPSQAEMQRMDLARVRAVQAPSAAIAWQEADGDARAYGAPDIIRRFADAAGVALSADDRPILARVLDRMISDAADYAKVAKAAYPRNRPYVGNPDIVPCNLKYIHADESYPSGHAMNGYAVGAVLADLFPGRDQAILARGVRYGDNRVVCGVHHPTDVDQGRMLAVAYLTVLRTNDAFRAEFACAREEDAVLARTQSALSAACRLIIPPARTKKPATDLF